MNLRVLKATLGTVLLFFAAALLCDSALAQMTSLEGTVRDPQQAVVPGAEVKLTNQGTGTSVTAVTDDQGSYIFAQVRPGTYSVSASLPGFKTAVISNVQLLVDTPATIDITLELGQVSEVITVAGQKEMVNKTDATIGNAFNSKQIVELPLESRNVFSLLSLQSGVTRDGFVTGARSDQSNLTLDGIDVNEQQTGEAFTSVLRVTPDSVQEFRVTTTTPNADQGRSSGAQVSLITKSGTNEFHGSLYEFHRNTVTTANDFFNNRVTGDPDLDGKPGVARPFLLRNLYGGSIGGPITKDKVFFFFNYEGRKDRKQESQIRTVPLANLGQGIVNYQNDAGQMLSLSPDDIASIFPATGGVNPLAVTALADAAARYPANDNSLGDGINTGGYRFNSPLPLDWNTYIARVDFNLNDKNQVFFRGNYQWDHSQDYSQFPDTPAPTSWVHPFGFVVSHTFVASSSLVNTARYGLTRQAFSTIGDASEDSIYFRAVYYPLRFTHTLSRTTPLHNITDDLSWTTGNHTFQFGTNIRVIRNQRQSYANSYGQALTNYSFYQGSGAVLSDPIPDLGSGSVLSAQAGLAAVIGRFSQYNASLIYGSDLNLLAPGIPSQRDFASEEYDFYAQDTWRVSPSLTLSYGLRWGVNTPVYETSGFQVQPTEPLGDFFDRRAAAAAQGQALNDLISFDLAGPYYNKPGFYKQSWTDFSPRVAAAWSPSFDSGFLHTLFGNEGDSVIRGGFSMLYDRLGSALAVTYDLNNAYGFAASADINANTYNVSDSLAPLFTGYDQSVRDLPGLRIPASITFPLTPPDDSGLAIQSSFDSTLQTPVNYQLDFSIGRQLPGGLYIEGSYIGRLARHLLAQRDVTPFNDIVDPSSGMDWYGASKLLAQQAMAGTALSDVQPIPFFENLFPNISPWGTWYFDENATYSPTQNAYALALLVGRDWTYVQALMNDDGIEPNIFYHPQFGSLTAWSTLASSDYHALAVTLKGQLTESLNLQFNYTLAKSIDDASGLQRAGLWDSSAFIINSLRPQDMRALSDFDMYHIINGNWLWSLPLGNGRSFANTLPGWANALLGGWDFNGVFRWNSGQPGGRTVDLSGWVTNWQIRSQNVRTAPVESSPTKSGDAPNFFENPTQVYQSFRTPYSGESGDRNIFRIPSYVSLDFGLTKRFKMPYAEGHSLVFRWEVFNATNTQRLAGPDDNLLFGLDPGTGTPQPDFGVINEIQGNPRVMQFALRYEF